MRPVDLDWLEDVDAPEVRRWWTERDSRTRAWLADQPQRPYLQQRLDQLWAYERRGVPIRRGERWFSMTHDGRRPHPRLCVLDHPGAQPVAVLDPAELGIDGAALSGMSITRDGSLVAYAVSVGGSDWQEWRVRRVADGVDLADRVPWSRFSGASWLADRSGFVYLAYPPPERRGDDPTAAGAPALKLHRLGTGPAADEVMLERPDHPHEGFDGRVTRDGRWLVVTAWQGAESRHRVLVRRLDLPAAPFVEIVAEPTASWSFVESEGDRLWFVTDDNAPNGRLVEADLGDPERPRWTERIAEITDPLVEVVVVGRWFLAVTLHHACARLTRVAQEAEAVDEIPLPEPGTIDGVVGDPERSTTHITFTSFTSPSSVYEVDVEAAALRLVHRPAWGVPPGTFTTTRYLVRSEEGTEVPVFVSRRADLDADGRAPALLVVYGGFGQALTPTFTVSPAVWMELGGVYAVAGVRGGGEYGRRWHAAGSGRAKPRAVDDLLAASSWLVDQGWAAPGRVAAAGGSNGGLVVASAMARCPDAFGAVVPIVGLLDMLRYHRLGFGWAWLAEYGDPDDPEDAAVLAGYSPLHTLRSGVAYPPLLVCAAAGDDRVSPAHSYKFVAALEALGHTAAPLLLRVDPAAGHNDDRPTAATIAELTDRLTFLTTVLDVGVPRTVR